jgi:hypothetical protein
MGLFFGPVRYKKRLPNPPKKLSDRAFFQNHSQVVPARIVGGAKGATKRAVVAVARKLAVLLHRLWVSGEFYKPFPKLA